MRKIIRFIIRIILAIMRALHFVWETLSIIAIVACILVVSILALIAETGEKLFNFSSSALTALVSRLGNKLTKEKT